MLAFFRVFTFYLATAVLLSWGLFALGWADALELPGFESANRTPAANPLEERAAIPPAPAAAPTPAPAQQRTAYVPPSEQYRVSEIQQPARPAVQASPQPAPMKPVDLPSLPKASVTTAEAARPRSLEPSKIEPLSKIDPVLPQVKVEPQKSVAAEPPRAAPLAPVAMPAPVAAEARPSALPPPPQKIVEAAPIARPPAPQMPMAVPPPAPAPPAASRAPSPVPTTEASSTRWAPVRRVAGFGIDALADNLDEVRRGSGDVPCVVLPELTFRAGTISMQARTREELELVSKVLNAQTQHRIEIGSRLGPGRPMASDDRLRAERVRLVRESLIALGVAPERLLPESNGTYERVTDDVAKTGVARRQSIGMCVHA